MIAAVFAAGFASFVLSLIFTRLMIWLAPIAGFVDKPGHRKIHHNPKPLGGGIAITWSFVLVLAGVLTAAQFGYIPPNAPDNIQAYIGGILKQFPQALGLIAAMMAMHLLGLVDDKKALGPYIKLFIQLAVTIALVLPFKDLRILTAIDTRVGSPIPSIVLTVLWITAISNALNFLDNMDGLSSGVAAICSIAFLITTLLIGQWFIAGALSILIGSLLGFLFWNFPPAKIFMGDSGSLVVGFVLGVLTARTTFLPPGRTLHNDWYAVLAPIIVLALPLYDLVVVSLIRLSKGKSPFVGDTNHFSHRLVRRGMSKRTAVLCLYLVTAATSIAAILLSQVESTFGAMLILAQTALVLGVIALLEQHPLPPSES